MLRRRPELPALLFQCFTEGVCTVAKKAAATLDFAFGEMAYGLTTGGVVKAVATGSTVPIGYAVAAAATGDTTVNVKLSR